MKQQAGRGGGGVERSRRSGGDCCCQCALAAAAGEAGTLCACAGDSGPAVKPAVASRQKAGPHPISASLFPAWPCPCVPSPIVLGVLASWGPSLPKGPRRASSAELKDLALSALLGRLAGARPWRTLAPIWLPHCPACRCTISRMAVALVVDAAAAAVAAMPAAVVGRGRRTRRRWQWWCRQRRSTVPAPPRVPL